MRTLTVLWLAACAGASHPGTMLATTSPELSPDVQTFPAGPFPSSARFCAAWMGERAPGVEKEKARIAALCKNDPENQECLSGCGPAAECTVHPASAAGLEGFTSLESIQTFETCGPGNCVLTVGTKEGVWAIGQVPFCSGGEGATASLETTSVSGDDTKGLVWKLDHKTMENGERKEETVTVTCKPLAGAPSCTVTTAE